MTRRLPPYCFVLLALAVFATVCAAAPIVVESLDWAVADADLVVRGTISEHDRVRDKEELIWSTATIKVAEVLKGEKTDMVKFSAAHKSRFASDRLADLAKEKTEAIFCLVKSDRYKTKSKDYLEQPWALRISEGEVDHSAIDLSEKNNAFVVSLDARILLKKDDILKAASAASKAAAGKTPPQGRVRSPAGAEVVKKLSDGGPVWIFAPVNSRLEESAKEWLQSKDLDFRLEGIKQLKPFKSEANELLVKGLLSDTQSKADGKVKSYPVRKAAFDLLKDWGVQIKPPVFEETEK